jgi:signal transduction histidine kinase
MLTPVMMNLLFGFALGIAVTIPLIYLASQRTERRVRQLEAQRRANERLAEQGRLTGGLAHEIKNPLSTVGLNLQLVEEDLHELIDTVEAQTDLHERLGRMQRRFGSLGREIQRLRDILEDFLRFAGRIRLDRSTTDVAAMIDEMVDFFTPQAEAAGVRLRTQKNGGDFTADLDASLIKQALLNLLINAVQAMTDGRDRHKPHGGCNELILRIDQQRDRLYIHITDTGPGIEAEQLDKLFEPYFSTKKAGTGLGLPTSRRIVEEHGGTLTCHSEPGRGTDFVIALPLGEKTGA